MVNASIRRREAATHATKVVQQPIRETPLIGFTFFRNQGTQVCIDQIGLDDRIVIERSVPPVQVFARERLLQEIAHRLFQQALLGHAPKIDDALQTAVVILAHAQ